MIFPREAERNSRAGAGSGSFHRNSRKKISQKIERKKGERKAGIKSKEKKA